MAGGGGGGGGWKLWVWTVLRDRNRGGLRKYVISKVKVAKKYYRFLIFTLFVCLVRLGQLCFQI